ncbi:MAG TPA: hypothetical protein VIB79_18345 [Candidatus Binatia bacterium]
MKTFRHVLARIFGQLGRNEGAEQGPEPGDGAVIHHSSGEADFDGSDGEGRRPAKDAHRDLPYPPDRSTD